MVKFSFGVWLILVFFSARIGAVNAFREIIRIAIDNISASVQGFYFTSLLEGVNRIPYPFIDKSPLVLLLNAYKLANNIMGIVQGIIDGIWFASFVAFIIVGIL